MIRRSAHLTRIIIEGLSNYSAYRGGKISYTREYDPTPNINVDLTSRMDIHRAIKLLYQSGDLSSQEIKMLSYVISDGRLSRRDISAMIKEEEGIYIDQRTISRRLESAYLKISKFLGFEYQDSRIFKMVAKRMGRPAPYILNDDEIDKIQQLMEKV